MVNASNYTIPMPENATSLGDLMVFANETTPYGHLVLLAIYMTFFLYLARQSRARTMPSMIAAGFVTMLSSYLMYLIGLFGTTTPLALTIGTMGLAVVFYLNKK